MRPLTTTEKRTIKLGAVGLVLYLVLFYGVKGMQRLEALRGEFADLSLRAESLKLEVLREQVKAQKLEKLRAAYRLDLEGQKREGLAGEASAAIQNAAQTCGIQLGPTRETSGRSHARELAQLQLEGVGPIPSAVQFVSGIESLGYPLYLDSLQVKTAGMQPGQVQLSVTVVILDYSAWKPEEARRA